MNSNRDYATENINLKKRLEALEKENIELRQEVSALEDYSYDVDCEKELLIKENEKLKNEKEQIKLWVINKIKYLDKGVFLMSGERVKGAIEILNELLKEVLSK